MDDLVTITPPTPWLLKSSSSSSGKAGGDDDGDGTRPLPPATLLSLSLPHLT